MVMAVAPVRGKMMSEVKPPAGETVVNVQTLGAGRVLAGPQRVEVRVRLFRRAKALLPGAALQRVEPLGHVQAGPLRLVHRHLTFGGGIRLRLIELFDQGFQPCDRDRLGLDRFIFPPCNRTDGRWEPIRQLALGQAELPPQGPNIHLRA